MRVHPLVLTLLVAAAVATGSCDESLSSVAGPTPNLQPTFSSIQSQIFENGDSSGRTACVSCHSGTGRTPLGGLNLDHAVAYDQCVNAPSRGRLGAIRVLPGDAEGSYMIHKLEGTPGIAGLRMPRNGPPYLTDGQVLIIKRWIAIGAPRN
jgi:hypothetical protein